MVFVRIGLVFSLCLAAGTSGIANDDWRRRLLEEAPAQWKALDDFWSNAEGDLRFQEFPVPATASQKPPKDYRISFSVVPDSIMMKRRKKAEEGQPERDLVRASNPKYTFDFQQNSGSEDKQIRYLGPLSEDLDYFFDSQVRNWIRAPSNVAGRNLIKSPPDPRIIVESVTAIERDGRQLVKAEFRANHDTDKPLDERNTSTYTFDPNDYWAVQEYVLRTPKNRIEGSIEYGEKTNGVPTPKVVRFAVFGTGPEKLQTIVEFERLVPEKADPETFLIGTYGLPEPGIESPQSSSGSYLWILLIVAGALAICSAVLIKFISNRRSLAVDKSP